MLCSPVGNLAPEGEGRKEAETGWESWKPWIPGFCREPIPLLGVPGETRWLPRRCFLLLVEDLAEASLEKGVLGSFLHAGSSCRTHQLI